MKEINKAAIPSWLRSKKILRVYASDYLTVNEEKDVTKEVEAIRRRGNGVCLLLVETQ